MKTIFSVGIILIIVSLLSKKKYSPLIGFALVFLIMGFESGVGKDFLAYMDDYEMTVRLGKATSRTLDQEPVIAYLMLLFSYFSPFWFFVCVKSLFQCVVLSSFVKRYSPKPYQYVAAILFFFSFNMMLLQMHAMRQGLAIEFILCAFLLIDRRKGMVYALLMAILAYYTHNSSLIAFPFIIIYYFACKEPGWLETQMNGKILPFILLALYGAVFVVKTTILNDYLVGFALLDEDFRLSGYLSEKEMENAFEISWLIVLYDAIVVFLVAFFYNQANSKMRVFCWISIFAAFGDMLFFGIGSLPRMIMYYVVFNLAVYPWLLLKVEQKFGKVVALVLLVIFLGYAVKTSLPWIMDTEDIMFGNYHFVFLGGYGS